MLVRKDSSKGKQELYL